MLSTVTMAMQHCLRPGDDDNGGDGDDDNDDGDGGDGDGDGGDDDHLVLVVPTSRFEGMGTANKHSGLLGLRNHSDVVLTLRLRIIIIIIISAIIIMNISATILFANPSLS